MRSENPREKHLTRPRLDANDARDAVASTEHHSGPPGYIYAIKRGASAIKFGKTAKHVSRRLFQLQSGCPEKLEVLATTHVPDCGLFEKLIHAGFVRFHLRGEWFQCCPMTLALAEQMARGDVAALRRFLDCQFHRSIEVAASEKRPLPELHKRLLVGVYSTRW